MRKSSAQDGFPSLVLPRLADHSARERYDYVAVNIFDEVKNARDLELFERQCLTFVKTGNLVKLRELILKWKQSKKGISMDFKDVGTGNTPIIFAAIQNNKEILRLLLEQDADLTLRNNESKTAVHLANTDLQRLMLSEKLNTDLKHAAWQGNVGVVRHMLRKDCGINERNKEGLTPLLLAARDINFFEKLTIMKDYEPLKVVKTLLEHNVNVTVEDFVGKSALHHLVDNIGLTTRGIANELLTKIKKVDRVDRKEFTPLHTACKLGDLVIVEMLLKNGASTSSMTADGKTPLHYAVINGHEKIAELLVKYEADTDLCDDRGQSPMDIAKRQKNERLLAVLQEANHEAIKRRQHKTSKSESKRNSACDVMDQKNNVIARDSDESNIITALTPLVDNKPKQRAAGSERTLSFNGYKLPSLEYHPKPSLSPRTASARSISAGKSASLPSSFKFDEANGNVEMLKFHTEGLPTIQTQISKTDALQCTQRQNQYLQQEEQQGGQQEEQQEGQQEGQQEEQQEEQREGQQGEQQREESNLEHKLVVQAPPYKRFNVVSDRLPDPKKNRKNKTSSINKARNDLAQRGFSANGSMAALDTMSVASNSSRASSSRMRPRSTRTASAQRKYASEIGETCEEQNKTSGKSPAVQTVLLELGQPKAISSEENSIGPRLQSTLPQATIDDCFKSDKTQGSYDGGSDMQRDTEQASSVQSLRSSWTRRRTSTAASSISETMSDPYESSCYETEQDSVLTTSQVNFSGEIDKNSSSDQIPGAQMSSSSRLVRKGSAVSSISDVIFDDGASSCSNTEKDAGIVTLQNFHEKSSRIDHSASAARLRSSSLLSKASTYVSPIHEDVDDVVDFETSRCKTRQAIIDENSASQQFSRRYISVEREAANKCLSAQSNSRNSILERRMGTSSNNNILPLLRIVKDRKEAVQRPSGNKGLQEPLINEAANKQARNEAVHNQNREAISETRTRQVENGIAIIDDTRKGVQSCYQLSLPQLMKVNVPKNSEKSVGRRKNANTANVRMKEEAREMIANKSNKTKREMANEHYRKQAVTEFKNNITQNQNIGNSPSQQAKEDSFLPVRCSENQQCNTTSSAGISVDGGITIEPTDNNILLNKSPRETSYKEMLSVVVETSQELTRMRLSNAQSRSFSQTEDGLSHLGIASDGKSDYLNEYSFNEKDAESTFTTDMESFYVARSNSEILVQSASEQDNIDERETISHQITSNSSSPVDFIKEITEMVFAPGIDKMMSTGPSRRVSQCYSIRGDSVRRSNSICSISTQTSGDGSECGEEELHDWVKGNILDRGAFGTVYLGMTSKGKMVAVKQFDLIFTDDGIETERQRKKLQDEIQMMKSLSHRNIVKFIGTRAEENHCNIFMEYIPGGSLAMVLKRFGPLSEQIFQRYTRHIVNAVVYLHQNGIMHGDIKGANIMLTPGGVVKLVDFGCAKRLNLSLSSTPELLNSVKGTPYWMAPEVIRGKGHNCKSDIWSIGCTVYELATGKPPWTGDPLAAMFTIASYESEVPELPSEFSALARDFVANCLTREPNDRPSAEKLKEHQFLRTSNGSRKP